MEYYIQSSETQLVSRFWLIDVRDSYFQGDPFFFVGTKPALHIFNGVESKNINGCGWNSGWIKDCFGTTTLGKVGSNSIICSGVTAGTAQSIRDYVERMFLVITGVDNKLGGKFPQCERNGVDQGVHNVLVHSPGVLSNVFRWSQRDTPVANMQAAVCTIKGNEVFNSKGERVVVVHQYDRYPQLQRYLFSKVMFPLSFLYLFKLYFTVC